MWFKSKMQGWGYFSLVIFAVFTIISGYTKWNQEDWFIYIVVALFLIGIALIEIPERMKKRQAAQNNKA